MESQDIGLLVLPVILLVAFAINYFDKRFMTAGEQRSARNPDRRDDTSAPL
ncbi:MAG: hypothetical protein Q7J43_06495 [Pseudomonas sp.]|uniref:hypothetical protein n=1 Tax=Pseudomonas sp. TaxID=306 RepID=UPI00271A9C62|nr:hypothetical protein [Pseudomonas sp.]MDO9617317.1 hypothetical protein [Pseudomonas sp.]MDP2446423.1 hypothetical protein [Pseudomonas sp.]MDZ4335201.1 hypothetical protein [Pseudomonas sp.]